MISMASQSSTRPAAIAPAPPRRIDSPGSGGNGAWARPAMAYTCQTCAKRKVKCDKATPTCSSCRKSQLECVYEAPQPRVRKRKLSGHVLEQLAQYERILQQHGLLGPDQDPSPPKDVTAPREPMTLVWDDSESSGNGTLLASQGTSRYVNSRLWRKLGDDELQSASDQEDVGFPSDPFTGTFIGSPQLGLLQHHPTHQDAMMLWDTHTENVEPLCKILHLPSTRSMVERISREPAMASKPDECLLFAIYHFAVFSMADGETTTKLGHSRDALLEQYHFATRQALVNVSFLKTTDPTVLQALVLLLLSSRDYYDSHTFWILTGVAVRIAQRIGVHRDGQTLGLAPFEVEMRRRSFYQLMPLEAKASQMAGMGASMLPDGWDTRPPLNIDDAQIWPGMAESPQEQKGATEMIFCLSRACIGGFFAKQVRTGNGTTPAPLHFETPREADQLIGRAESEVEEKYIRYCDVVNPLHFLTVCSARSGITAMRLRIQLPKAMSQIATDAETKDAFQLAGKILDTDMAVCAHAGLAKYRWHVKPFCIWGTWDSSIFVLTTLWRRGNMLSTGENDAAWGRVEALYRHHDDLLKPKRALYVALGRLTLKAWEANPPSNASSGIPEPAFIASLRCRRDRGRNEDAAPYEQPDTIPPLIISPTAESATNPDHSDNPGAMRHDLGNDFGLEAADWVFWDGLIKDYEPLGGEE
ncbi:hypothetical protein C8A00DRAFT_15318 [Chaetomidium leptoderma]|uniref:Zn(2)-C6 fungal-type domain-containing protein n=1 Tax=Chaetomidium leptoderma TaxID=669021 RepID=A0AAN6VKV7_9PEZI|nr:hypothetical protein C8A00DRAFT_15318 [Chaetomidium leptoderma]